MLTALALTLALASQDLRTPPDGPTEVAVNVFVTNILLVDEPKHAFMADVVFELAWDDARLADESEEDLRRMPLTTIWTPRATLLNARDVKEKFERVARVDSTGRVYYMQRYTGWFNASFDLRDFPIDDQSIRFELVFVGAAEDNVTASVDTSVTGQRETFSITDWRVGPGQASIETFRPLPDSQLPLFVYEIPVERRTGYYIWKILMPLVFITGMAGTVFWIDPKNSGPQISVSVSSILTLIAYRFALGTQVPRLSYLTRLDYFITGATIMVFGALVVVITTSALAEKGHHKEALKIDRYGRLAYPPLLLALVGGVFLT